MITFFCSLYLFHLCLFIKCIFIKDGLRCHLHKSAYMLRESLDEWLSCPVFRGLWHPRTQVLTTVGYTLLCRCAVCPIRLHALRGQRLSSLMLSFSSTKSPVIKWLEQRCFWGETHQNSLLKPLSHSTWARLAFQTLIFVKNRRQFDRAHFLSPWNWMSRSNNVFINTHFLSPLYTKRLQFSRNIFLKSTC